MRIKSLRVNQLHGFLDIELLLLDDLTIVVGANGTGKTSALLILSAMLRLDGKAMRAIKYSSAVLQLDDEVMGAIELISENADDFLISIKCRGDLVNLAPYFRTEPLLYKRAAGRAVSLYDRNALTALLQHSGIDESERSDAVRLAKQFLERAKLTFVQLDRSIVTRDPLGKSSVDSIAEYVAEKSRNSSIGDPIDEVIRVTKEKYLEYKNVVERVKDRAYLDSLSLHFKRIDPVLNEKKMKKKDLETKLKELKSKVQQSALTVDESALRSDADNFFEQFQKLVDENNAKSVKKRAGRRTLDDEQLEAILNLKYFQIVDLLAVFEEESKSNQEAYAPIRKYLRVVDKFFRESGKKLSFDAAYELTFSHRSPNDSPDQSEQRSLKELSSGERQVLILLTFLGFVSGQNSIFIVDEPELSLHLKWQGYLIDALRELRPENCQLVIATHSPEIAGRARDNCRSLLTANISS